MKIAALYDIHANPFALEATLLEINDCNVDMIFVGGDVVAGPMPKKTLDILRSVDIPVKYILGNAESELLRFRNGEKINGLGKRADEVARWVFGQLDKEDLHFIESWNKTEVILSKYLGKILCCHATPYSDIEIFTKLTPTEKLDPIFGNLEANYVICGHTHMQFQRKIGNVQVINAGSVGMPFGRTGADWLFLDRTVEFRNTSYDLKRAAECLLSSDYPFAESFVTNNVLTVPTEEDTLRMFSQMGLNKKR